MSKYEKYDGDPRPSDARRMQPDDEARQKRKKKYTIERPHSKRSHFLSKFRMHRGSETQLCYAKPVLNLKYDAYYCHKCLIWLEDKCDKTKNCVICQGRSSVKRALENETIS